MADGPLKVAISSVSLDRDRQLYVEMLSDYQITLLQVPLIDLSQPETKSAIQVRSACRDTGFFYGEDCFRCVRDHLVVHLSEMHIGLVVQ